MVGLSVVLEAQKGGSCSSSISKKTHQVINKTTMMLSSINTPSPSPLPLPLPLPPPSPPEVSLGSSHHFLFQAPTFLDQCFLCGKRLLPGNDIYMYKGDRAFCSVDCRCKQIFTDEQEAIQKGNCSSSTPRHHRKGARNRGGGGGGGFAY